MRLNFDVSVVRGLRSASQRARVLTEDWVDTQVYCPNCGLVDIDKYPNNNPAADFHCSNCHEDYELKSKNSKIGTRVVDGAYKTLIQKLRGSTNPNLFLLNYDPRSLEVQNFFVIPKHFFIPEIIEKRKPLVLTARRAGWVGCNILLHGIPQTGKIYFVKNRIVESKSKVLSCWKKTLFLREEKELVAKGWLLDVMRCVEQLSQSFSLDEVYSFAGELGIKHPGNRHIKDKIRQQLQVLRERGYLEFIGRGRYRRP